MSLFCAADLSQICFGFVWACCSFLAFLLTSFLLTHLRVLWGLRLLFWDFFPMSTKTVPCEQLCGSILSNAINTALRLGTFHLSRSVAAHAECDQPVASQKRQQLKVPSAMPQGGWSGTVGLFWCAVGSLTTARQWGSGSVALHELLMSIPPAMHFQNIKSHQH